MTTVIFRCDECDGSTEVAEDIELPEGWCRITLSDGEGTVCSFACAHEWLIAEEEGEGEDDET